MNQSSRTRLLVVDALRGFAIVSILLVHNLEHFDYLYFPKQLPEWMKAMDKIVWDTTFFLFSGKSYAIFALLFGLTFFIQSDNQAQKGKDFRGRFAWRLVLLFLFGLFNSFFYEGDILTIYAVLGFTLLPVAKLSNKAVLAIATTLMLQPFEWYNLLWGLQHPAVKLANPLSWSYFGKAGAYIEGTSFVDTMLGNFTNGKTAVVIWSWEAGRVFQTSSLFMLGMLAGSKQLFQTNAYNTRFWTRTLILSGLLAIPLYILKTNIPSWIPSMAIHRPLGTMVTTWYNFSFMLILVSSFVLLFQQPTVQKILNPFTVMGKMSMSNYIMQSIAGSVIYCGFGLGMYKYTGASYCLLIGIALAILQGIFCHWWMKNHKQGPLESIWHRLTWIK